MNLPLQPQQNVLANPLPPPLRDLFGLHPAEGQQVVLGPSSSQESEQVLLQDEDAQPQPRRLHGKFLHITGTECIPLHMVMCIQQQQHATPAILFTAN